MKSTLYLKFIIIYMIFGFMSLFTVATLTRTLTEEPLERDLAADVYQEANLVANEYLPHYFLGQIDESAVPYTTCWNGSASGRGSLVRRPGR